MTGLVLKLGPKERVLVNGAVIENGERRARVSILSPNANILRLRDAINPEEATTPVKRVCYTAQMVLSGDASVADIRLPLLRHIEELSQVFNDPDSCAHLARATDAVLQDEFYQCLKSLRALLPREARLLASGAA
jgi:flagellar protein FlbT